MQTRRSKSRFRSNEFDSTANITGIYQASSQNEACSAGFLCVREAQTPNEGYTGINNTNTWTMNAATAAANQMEPIYACNTFGVNELADPVTGAVYKAGTNTLGCPSRRAFPAHLPRSNSTMFLSTGSASGT